ncbi:hypothetical protein [Haliscomenobacter sp.]|uniref:hypothetical protein n=1 Tax=Haliscomenobacter sp. TaxID=2717303 RepID=UPI003364BE7E
MSNSIANILKRLAVIEADVTPAKTKHGLNAQQKSVPQLPALFKPETVSPVLGSNKQSKPFSKYMVGDDVEPTQTALAERMAEIDEDMLSKVKKDLTQYLDKLEKQNHLDSHLVSKAKRDLEIGDDEEVDEDPTEDEPSGEDYVPPPTINPVVAEAGPVKTITLEDGTCLECYGDQVRGFEIRHLGRVLPSRFGSLDEADMAVRMFQAHRKHAARNSSADYIEEA